MLLRALHILWLFFCLVVVASVNAKQLIDLPFQGSSTVTWQGNETEFYSKTWNIQAIRNISTPQIDVYTPAANNRNGAAVIIAPGGAMHVLNIDSEGRDVAKWLADKGFLAVVLKYRLVPNTVDPTVNMAQQKKQNPVLFAQQVNQVLPLATQDAFTAIKYVRDNHQSFHIAPNKVGIMGFSAGGAVAMAASYYYQPDTRPDFFVAVYPWTAIMPVHQPPKDAPPMLVVAAANDPLNLAAGAVSLFSAWQNNGHSASLHMFAKGGHGFGMTKNQLASDKWIELFYDWSQDLNMVNAH